MANYLLPRISPLQVLLTMDANTLKITNQKNVRMGQTIHLETIKDEHSHVKALIRRVHHTLTNGETYDALLCLYANGGKMKAVTPEK
eukprot:6085061-Ditylum_brightwellii.AAC.2